MILFADSGSTKSDWLLVNDQDRLYTSTMGFNPFFHNSKLIASELVKNDTLYKYKSEVSKVFYFGAGCSSAERNKIVQDALSTVFTNASHFTIDQDINAAAYATCSNQKGIVCILGTGANSCYYDGDSIHEINPALGYILGDEGSGAYFGKIIVSEYLYNRLPDEISDLIEKNGLHKELILSKIYKEPNANVFLASFMKLLAPVEKTAYFKEMIYNGLKHFAINHILSDPKHSSVDVHFVGSIAFIFQDILQELATDMDFKIGNIIQKPIDGLSDHFLKNEHIAFNG